MIKRVRIMLELKPKKAHLKKKNNLKLLFNVSRFR